MSHNYKSRAPRADVATLPQYSCHKIVRAARITDIRRAEGDGHPTVLEFGELGLELPIAPGWAERHQPVPGGYFVVYADGHNSYSPAAAFVDGYRPI